MTTEDTKANKVKIQLSDDEKRLRQAGYFKKHYEKNRDTILERLKQKYHEPKIDGKESLKEKQSRYYKQYYQQHREEILTRIKSKKAREYQHA